jgi:hypothetical protein
MKIILGLCEGRHEVPGVSRYILPQSVNPRKLKWIEDTAYLSISKIFNNINEDIYVDLYVTGSKIALVSVINVLKRDSRVKQIILYHYHKESGTYFPQKVE